MLPKTWKPNDAHRDYAAVHRLDLAAESERFRDWHALKGTKGVDWDAGFRNWMRKAIEIRDERAAAAPKPKADPDAWMNPRKR